MDDRIRQLLAKLNALEDELKSALHDREVPLFYHVRGKRVEFDDAVNALHRAKKVAMLRWFRGSRPPTVIVAPVIYSLILPLFLLDISLTVYQFLCFPAYRINKVKRSDYLVEDRWHLSYLNFMEKLNCAYCGYANGVLAYGTEIAARTEQYWCPIKHARKVLGSHARYERFIRYGDAEGYKEQLDEFRAALAPAASEPAKAEDRDR
jgi:hypothetical protein